VVFRPSGTFPVRLVIHSLTNEYEVDGDADCAGPPETVRTEQHQVADDAEVADAVQQDGGQDGAGREARSHPATKRRRAAWNRWRRGPREAAAARPPVKIRRLEGCRRRHGVVVDDDPVPTPTSF